MLSALDDVGMAGLEVDAMVVATLAVLVLKSDVGRLLVRAARGNVDEDTDSDDADDALVATLLVDPPKLLVVTAGALEVDRMLALMGTDDVEVGASLLLLVEGVGGSVDVATDGDNGEVSIALVDPIVPLVVTGELLLVTADDVDVIAALVLTEVEGREPALVLLS